MKDSHDETSLAVWRREIELRIEAVEQKTANNSTFIKSASVWFLRGVAGLLAFLAMYWAKAKGLL